MRALTGITERLKRFDLRIGIECISHLLLPLFLPLPLTIEQLPFLLLQLFQSDRQGRQLFFSFLKGTENIDWTTSEQQQFRETSQRTQTLMSLVRDCISVVNSTHCSFSC